MFFKVNYNSLISNAFGKVSQKLKYALNAEKKLFLSISISTGKVLQESQDENRKLRDEVSGLKQGLRESGVDVSQLSLHSSPASLQPSATRCFLSQCEDNSKSDPSLSHEPFEVLPKMPSLTLISHEFASEEKFSLSGPPALEFHIKVILKCKQYIYKI